MKNILIMGLLLSAYSTAFGQITESNLNLKYEQALLDTAILYERIKPAYIHLQAAYEFKGKEIEALRGENRLLRLQNTILQKSKDDQLTNEKRKGKAQRWIGRIEGLLIGLILPI